eukprot:Blabericola_migrator_1__4744@NODE_24_length_21460_cov_93_666994_g21_i0_p6_GENE_NODE_24_length_21460_cov_93_666994_g21_i0NODE_24_length_21460_cov_93_666994_g21_i0_p6_ORF_typecomplete_len353_score47_83ADH_N/PF08240_12/1e30ADH_zinc_N/PF00107_26/1_2e18Glu_dehyd_C/PF16912_5/2_1e11AlaDh_PNT_C/PF01262_21/3_3e052Hacid_dh_C/PF02826_19/4_5e05Shikimate_DH/PF01488_20/0_00051NAD_binding_2/PF03446_15/0_0007Pyr_redox_2/PF07992_14/0_0097DUF2284/PF10050_9/0_077NqrM/PF04400_13/5_5e03NqrM/PF04400_13/0_0513HCDH_N/P
MPISNRGYAALAPCQPLQPFDYEIRDVRDIDVLIEVHFCGICHSDIHQVRDDWSKGDDYPIVPGHEFTGVVTQVGSKVTKFAVNDRVGVGCRVGSCRECKQCKRDLEQYCSHAIRTYRGRMPDGEKTYGGYGKYVVVDEHFVVKLPDSLPMDTAAPLLCAGITTYSPIMHNGINKGGLKVGVVGLGGLGHMAVQYAAKMGNEVIVLSRSEAKKELALTLGAKDLIAITNEASITRYQGTLNYIIDTVSSDKPVDVYLDLLDVDGILITVGLPPVSGKLSVPPFSLIMQRKSIQGSCIGGMKETQEMIDYSAANDVLPYVEVITGDYINEAYERTMKGDVRFRFVIDVRKTFP